MLPRCGELAAASEKHAQRLVQAERAPAVAGEQLPGEPLALRPAANVQKAGGKIIGYVAAHGMFQAEFAGTLVALLRVLKGVAFAAS